MARANTLGASAIAAAVTLAVASLEPARTGAADLWSNRKAVSDEQLDNMRGGFEAANGLQISFGIERAVVINGELVAVTRLVVSNLPNLLKGGIASGEVFANAFTVVQNGPGNSVENQPAAASGAQSASPAAVPGTTATVSATPAGASTPSPLAAAPGTGAAAPSSSVAGSAAPVGATTSSAAASVGAPASSAAASAGAPASSAAASAGAPASSTSVAVSAAPVGATTSSAAGSAGVNGAASSGLQSVQFNGQTLILPNPTAIVTAVQNSLNNQVIQTRTSIDATMNSLSFMRSGAFADALRQQTLLSVRR